MSDRFEQEIRAVIRQSAEISSDFDLARLDDLGWDDLQADDAALATRVFFEEHGALRLTGAALELVARAGLELRDATDGARVLFPMIGAATCSQPDRILGIDVSGPGHEGDYLAPLDTTDGVRIFRLPRSAVTVAAVGGIDPSLAWSRVHAGARGTLEEVDGDWAAVLIASRRALAHQLLGMSRRMLQIAVEHVTVRTQFGRPIGSNQAVQHRLADSYVELAAATVIVEECWVSPTSLLAIAAKAAAGRAFESISSNGQQVLGGMGYSWEHDWHRFVRRGLVLSVFLGSVAESERELGRLVRLDGVPRIGDMA